MEQGQTAVVGVVKTADQPNRAGKIELDAATLTLKKTQLPVVLSHAWMHKIRYKHQETGTLEIRLTNDSAVAHTVQVRPVIVNDADECTPGAVTTLKVAPASTIATALSFPVPNNDGGYEAVAELLDNGKVIDQLSGDVFCVSDDVFQFAMASNIWVPNLLSWAGPLPEFKKLMTTGWDKYVQESRAGINAARRDYCTYFEYFAWAHEDASMLVEKTDDPYLAGQCGWPVSPRQLKLLNGLMRDQGIAPVGYVDAEPFGWPGFDVVRRHPEWYVWGGFNTKYYENYRLLNQEGLAQNYPVVVVNYDKKSTNGQTFLDYHIDQLIASAKMYGWEGYRYDAGPLPAKYFPTVKAALAKQNPPVGIGNNLGICCLGNQPSKDWTTYCQGKSLMMEEMINGAFGSPTSPQRRWKDWILLLRQGAELTRMNGGHYTIVNGSGNWLSNILLYAAEGHPSYGTHDSPYGNSGRFMVRYGYYFWDMRTQFLAKPTTILTVNSPVPVWWEPFAAQRTLSPAHRQVLVPLVQPPAGDEVVDLTYKAPAQQVTVALTPNAGETVTAFALCAEPTARRIPLSISKTADGKLQVTAPRFWAWATVVFDCEKR